MSQQGPPSDGGGDDAARTDSSPRRTPRPSRPASSSGRPIARPKGRPPRGQGSGRRGKVKLRDVSGGWPRFRHILRKTFLWGSITFASLIVAGVIAIYVIYKTISLPDPNSDFQAQTTVVYYSDGTHVLGSFALQNRQSIPLAQMPVSLRNAVIAAEDRSFYTNSGIDLKGILRAAWHNLHSNTEEGGSTITQQYVKVLYLTQERTWKRKIQEAFLALKLQNELSKDQILQGYLNTIYFGRGAYGVQAAAQAYFDKDAKDLTIPQSAVLASVLNSPGNLDPANGKAARRALLARYRYVLAGMESMGNLSASHAATFERRLPAFPHIKTINKYGGQKGYLMTMVKSQLEALHFTDAQIEGGGLKVVTTLDWDKERAAGQTIKAVRPKGLKELHVSLTSIEPGTGAVRALIGGKNYLQSQINWATTGVQPGSTFKAFALAAALKYGYTLQSTFDGDSPYTYPDGQQVHNEGESSGVANGESYGSAISLLYATEQSVNTAFADMTVSMKNGPHRVVRAATSLGIPRDSPGLEANEGVALGSAQIPNIDMAAGYAAFADNGKYAPWYLIQQVKSPNGLVYEHQAKPIQVFSPAIASNVTYALEQVVKDGTGENAQALGRPAAGKTGTATAIQPNGDEDVSSSWFVGYTPQLATAVTYCRGDGNDSLEGYLVPFFGANYPTQTWTQYMSKALKGQPIVDFPAPAELHGVSPTTSAPSTSPTTAPTAAPTTAPTTTAPTTTASTARTTTTTTSSSTTSPTTNPTTPSTPPTTPTTPPATTSTTGPTSRALGRLSASGAGSSTG